MFSLENFMPHGHCFLWRPDLLWTLVIGNAVIALSYFSIPLSLMILTRKRRNDRLKWILLMFSAFIFACGATHVVDIIVIWYPDYWLDAGFKLATASISAVTAVALWPIVAGARSFVTNQLTEAEYLKGSNIQLQESITALQQQHSDYQRLNRMSGYLQVCNNIDEIVKTIVETVRAIWPQTQGALYLMQPDDSEFRLAGQWRSGDTPCRYGGEEFTLILPDTSLEQAVEVANRVRTRLEIETHSKFPEDEPLRNLTTSAGVAQYDRHGKDRDSLLQQVDQALYRAKQDGRNRVVTAAGTAA